MSGTFFKRKHMSMGDLFWNDTFGELINLRLMFYSKHWKEKPCLSNLNYPKAKKHWLFKHSHSEYMIWLYFPLERWHYDSFHAFRNLQMSLTESRFIYILDSSNSNSFTFWSSRFTSSSRSNWTGISTGNSNGTWTDIQSSHFSTAKEISVKGTFVFM